VALSKPQDWLAGIDITDPAATARIAEEEFDGWAPELTEYEQALFPRGAAAAAESARNHGLLFGDDTPHSLINLITGREQIS
jgi:hypothetical protein